jgi:hypothetical protein
MSLMLLAGATLMLLDRRRRSTDARFQPAGA